ncbi:alpha-1,2-fucosyltransferase [bacterium]|nr:alpha-1,2-fucosyltransferase [bacterium]
MDNIKIVKLMGGIGNQMFEYAFGLALQKNQNCKLLFDTSYFDEMVADKNGLPSRFYELGIFQNLNIEFAPKKLVKEFEKKSPLPKFLCSLLGVPRYKYFVREKNAFKYDKKLLDKRGNTLIEGYFQNEKYYSDIKDELKHCFELPSIMENDVYNQNLFEKIKSTKNSVFVHLRRSEYVNLGMDISENYYKHAAKYIAERIKNPKFFVFCAEDVDYVKNKFDLGFDFELVGEQNTTRENFYENMRMMMACEHAIIANSSYSWWAAYLSDFDGKIVVAPTPWINGQDDVICHNWVKIKSQC